MNRRLPLNRRVLLFAAVLSVVIAIACAGCSDLPVDEFGPHSGGGGGGADTEIQTPTPNWVEEATPIRTPASVVTATPVPTKSESLGTPQVYSEIYAKNIYLLYNVTALNYDLIVPAMIIDLDIKPKMEKNTKEYTSTVGSKGRETSVRTYPLPRASLVITILDRDTGKIIEEHDFQQFTEEHEKHTIILRYAGNYQLEIAGNDVNLGIKISVPEENLQGGNKAVTQS